MESECVDDQQAQIMSVIVPSTLVMASHIPECVDGLLGINLDIQMASHIAPLMLSISPMLME